jgi:PKD repeat protein
VTFDASSQEPGQYLGLLDVVSNDPATPHLGIPVTMTVLPPCDPVTGTAFTWEPLTPTVGALVTLTAEATGTGSISFSWAFGDGSLARGIVITHSYAHPGTYPVLLTATNLCGQETVERDISVADLPPQPQYRYLYLPLVLRESNQ